MGVKSVSSTTADTTDLPGGSTQNSGERRDAEFRKSIAEARVTHLETPAAQHPTAVAPNREPGAFKSGETLLAIARYDAAGPQSLRPKLASQLRGARNSGQPNQRLFVPQDRIKVAQKHDPQPGGSGHVGRPFNLIVPPGRDTSAPGAVGAREPLNAPDRRQAGMSEPVAFSLAAALAQAKVADGKLEKAKGGPKEAEQRQQAEAAWKSFGLDVADRLLRAGNGHLFPDEGSQLAIKSVKRKYGRGDAKANEEIEHAAAQVTAFWQHVGLTGSQFDKIVRDAQAASAAAHGAGGSQSPPNGQQTAAQLETAARESWDWVAAAIESKLEQNAGDKIYPEDGVKRDIHELKARLPHRDGNFNAAASVAGGRAEDEWRREGRTRDTLGVILGLARKMKQAARTGNQARIAQAQGALEVEIEKQLRGAIRGPGREGELPGLLRAAGIAQRGPQDQLFEEALKRAFGNVFVKPRIEAVEHAFGPQHDAVAAARELATQTHGTFAPVAKLVLEQSLLTVASIAEDINVKQTVPADKLEAVFHSLSTATEDVLHAEGGDSVVSNVAAAIAKDFPAPFGENASGPVWLTVPYIHAITASVGNGDGAALPLAISSHLKGERQRLWVTNAIAAGAGNLQRKVGQVVADHLLTPLNRFYVDQAYLPAKDLDRAAETYAREHPEAQAAYQTTLRTLQSLGLGAMRTVYEIAQAMPQFADFAGLENALRSLQHDKYMQYIMARSPQVVNEVNYLAMQMGEVGGSSALKPESAMKRGLRELIKSLVATSSTGSLFDSEWFNKGGKFATSPDVKFPDVFSGRQTGLDVKKAIPANIPFNIIGNLVYGAQFLDAVRSFQHDPNVIDAAKSIYATLGFSKELFETLAIGVQKGWWSVMSETTAASILAKSQRGGMLNFRSLSKDPAFVQLGYGLKVAGAALDSANAFKAFEKQQYISGSLYGISAVGGGVGAFSSIATRGTFAAEWGATLGGGIALAASLGLYIYQDYQAARAHEDRAKEFLEDAGIDPRVATTLAKFDSEGRSAGPVFAAMLEAGGVTQEEFKRFLCDLKSQDDLDKLGVLVERARRVSPTEVGVFPRTVEIDDPVTARRFHVTRLNLSHPRSLSGVLMLGHELFRGRFPGPYRLPEG